MNFNASHSRFYLSCSGPPSCTSMWTSSSSFGVKFSAFLANCSPSAMFRSGNVAHHTQASSRLLSVLPEEAWNWARLFVGDFSLIEYPSRRSEKVNCHFVHYRLSFRKLQIFISFRFAPFRFANYSNSKPVACVNYIVCITQVTMAYICGQK